jgi:hypothetical protein
MIELYPYQQQAVMELRVGMTKNLKRQMLVAPT